MNDSVRWIVKAGRRLDLAKTQLERIKMATSHNEIEGEWYLFLVCARNVISMIEMGAKNDPAVKSWFDEAKRQRHENPVANYMHHARHDDEHGLRQVTSRGVMVEHGPEDAMYGVHPVHGNAITGFDLSGGITHEFCELAPVSNSNDVMAIDRRKRTDPPRLINPPSDEYLNSPPPEKQAIKAAEMEVEYLHDLLEDAASVIR